MTMFPKGDSYPILFEEVYKRIDSSAIGAKSGSQIVKDKSSGAAQNHF